MSDKEISPGELKEQLQFIEQEIVDLEKKAAKLESLKEENRVFRGRMKNLEHALYGMLVYASHPAEPELAEKHLAILLADLENLPKAPPGPASGEKKS